MSVGNVPWEFQRSGLRGAQCGWVTVCGGVCACTRVHVHVHMLQNALDNGGSWRGVSGSGVAGEVEKQATLYQLEAHTLYGGEDMEGVCVCWDGFRSIFCDHHKIPSSDWFTRVPLF